MSHAAFDSLAGLLEGPISARYGNNSDIIGKVKRIIDKASEVMVKVSGNAKSPAHMKSHLDYISRNGKLELETERGERIKGKDAVKMLHKEWSLDQMNLRRKTRYTTNIVLSMPKGTAAKAVRDSARAFATKQFGENYQYVFVLHTDVKHPHVHLTVKNLGHDGRRLQVNPGDFQKWREVFAKKLRQRGIEAEATPRAPRGVVKKPVKQVIKHIRDKGLVPKVDKARVQEIILELKDARDNKPVKAKPWEQKIKNSQTRIRQTWLSAAKQLNTSSDPTESSLARQIVRFVQAMPTLDTLRHEVASKLTIMLNQQQAPKVKDLRQREQKDIKQLDREYER